MRGLTCSRFSAAPLMHVRGFQVVHRFTHIGMKGTSVDLGGAGWYFGTGWPRLLVKEGNTLKTCSRCHEAKPRTEYHRKSVARDGLAAHCKACVRAYKSEYDAEHKNTKRAYGVTYYARNKGAIAVRHSAYRAMVKEHYPGRWRETIKHDATIRVRMLAASAELYRTGRASIDPKWLSKEVGYAAAHGRVRSVFGRATSHACEGNGCDRAAEGWALTVTHGPCVRTEHKRDDRNGKIRPMQYSLNPADYRPLCRPCHVRLDAHGIDVFASQ